MRLWLLRFAASAIALASAAASAAPNYVEAPPLTKVLDKVAVKDVAAGTVQVPMITWGGDIATILANGNQLTSVKGSPFANEGLDLKLVREDVFSKQIEAYLSGRSPYLRGTLGMINMAADIAGKDPRTKPIVIYQLTWSAGGDSLVVKSGIGSAKDLKGKTIALQAYGPHVDYLTKMLADAGLTAKDVTIKWLPDLTGSKDTPMAALQSGGADAAFVITPDAMVLTSGGSVGNGAEDSVKGARILLSTKTANRIIADVYAVRSDYFQANRKAVEGFVHALMIGEEKLRDQVKNKAARAADYKTTFTAAAKILMDSEKAFADAEGMYGDAEFVGHAGNVDFFANPNFPRNLDNLSREAQQAFAGIGLVAGGTKLASAGWDYSKLKQGLATAAAVAESKRFDQNQVAAVVTRKQQQGTLAEGELFSFEIYFEPNQNGFTADLYADAFAKVVDLASTYGGALITVEGHSDPMAYLRDKKDGKPEVVLGRVKQSAKNLSLSRAVAVRDSLIAYARGKNISLDESQFAVVGHGISKPKNGVCGEDPCAPKNEREWRDNMRVVFRLIQVEAESTMFKPL